MLSIDVHFHRSPGFRLFDIVFSQVEYIVRVVKNTTAIGNRGEAMASEWLEAHGFALIERNWKTRWYEIDIVVKRCSRFLNRSCSIHFVEVKFRKNALSGEPSDYVTAKKQAQMARAAQSWVADKGWSGPWQLDTIGIDGETGEIVYTPNITQG